jgi:DUF4097 and DUF4098 domain-containing protein YvlB
MKNKLTLLVSMCALAAVSLTIHAQGRRSNPSVSTSLNGDRAVDDCGDIQIKFDRRPAITEATEMRLAASQVSTLRTQMTNGGIYINGWDRNEYSIQTCKAVPDDSEATRALREITTTTNANGQIIVSGPNDREWTANLIIRTPRLSRMEIETRNGPLQIRDLAGDIHLRATNGPISLNNVGGVVETTTTNGPISIRGASGDQRVNATNGPISVALSGTGWDGPGLEVTTSNGPLTLSIPDTYNSGIAIQTGDRSPVSCRAAACAGATRSLAGTGTGVIRLGSGEPTVRVSTKNGPLSIRPAGIDSRRGSIQF